MKILMVCLGNICRSPLAEGIMRSKIEKFNLQAEVDSAGFEAFHTGDAPDYRAIKVANRHGVDISGIRSRLFRKSDFKSFDRIYVMDSNNYNDVQAVSENQSQMLKVDYILNCTNPGTNLAVPDPYYGGEDGFEKAYQLLDKATELIAMELQKKNTKK